MPIRGRAGRVIKDLLSFYEWIARADHKTTTLFTTFYLLVGVEFIQEPTFIPGYPGVRHI